MCVHGVYTFIALLTALVEQHAPGDMLNNKLNFQHVPGDMLKK